MTVGERIKQKRIELNLSQEELAKKVGYKSRSSIQKIESARKLPLDKVQLMAAALDCTPSYIMGWEDEEGIKTLEGQLTELYAKNIAKTQTDETDLLILDLLHNVSQEAKDSFVQLLKSWQPQSELPHLHSKKD